MDIKQNTTFLFGLLLLPLPLLGQLTGNKKSVVQSIDKQQADLIRMSDQIWAFAETAFEETQSAKVLADYAAAQGLRVQRNLAGMPTAFTAEYGSGRPIIGILGEFDALPGLSQKAEPGKNPLKAGAPGHGCGHNLFGVASLAAAITELLNLSEDDRRTMSNRARQHARSNFTTQTLQRATLSVYDRLLGSQLAARFDEATAKHDASGT